MNRKRLAALGVPVILLLAAACEQRSESERGDVPPAAETPAKAVTQPPVATMTADVEAIGKEGANARGEVEILGGDAGTNTFLLSINLQGVPAGEHAWHIHRGKCGDANAPVAVALSQEGDEPALTGALAAAADSTVNGTVAIPMTELTIDQLRNDDYSVRIHSRAGRDHGPTIACADL